MVQQSSLRTQDAAVIAVKASGTPCGAAVGEASRNAESGFRGKTARQDFPAGAILHAETVDRGSSSHEASVELQEFARRAEPPRWMVGARAFSASPRRLLRSRRRGFHG